MSCQYHSGKKIHTSLGPPQCAADLHVYPASGRPHVVSKTVTNAATRTSCNFGASSYTYMNPSGFCDIGPGTDTAYFNTMVAAANLDGSKEFVLLVQRFDTASQIALPRGFKLKGSERCSANGVAYRLGGNDGVVRDDCSAFGYGWGAQFKPGAGYANGNLTINNACTIGVELLSTFYLYFPLRIVGCGFAACNWMTGMQGYSLQALTVG